MASASALYDTDFYLWTQEQAFLLAEGKARDLDWAHLAEEIADLGRSVRKAIRSQLKRLLLHLLKGQYQPEGRQTGHSWASSIRNARDEILDDLADNPSLRRLVPELVGRVYPLARHDAADETGLPLATFPDVCPWSLEDVLREDFWPEA